MEIKAWVFDRIWQSFVLLKNNFIWLFLPFFLYNFISIVLVWTISKYYMINSFAWINDMEGLDLFEFLNNSIVVIWITVGILFFIIYLLLYIIVLLWFLKSLKQAINWYEITIYENLKYWVENFTNSMKTYWYIFSYIVLLPSLLFIIWGIFFSISFFIPSIDFLSSFWILLIVLSLIIFVFFAIYRWVKSKFALYSAVNENMFTKDNFIFSVKTTNFKWLRIVGNFLLVWIIVWIISSFLSWIIWTFLFFFNWWNNTLDLFISSLYNWWNISSPDMWDVKKILDNYFSGFSIYTQLISNFIKNILTTLSSVYLLIFTYIFFIRLKEEKSNKSIEL